MCDNALVSERPDRTYQNACQLSSCIGAELSEINIRAAVKQHFEDIGHSMDVHDVTYENSQARERTQVLMDLANPGKRYISGEQGISRSLPLDGRLIMGIICHVRSERFYS